MTDGTTELHPAAIAGGAGRLRGSGIVVLLRSVLTHRNLVRELARREITDVHAGQAAGALWVIVHPIVMFAVYAFLFTAVFKVRIGDSGPSGYLIYLFAGLAPWLMTQDVLSRATGIMFANSTIVKKVMFPAEALVAKSLLASFKVQSILLLIVIAYVVAARDGVPWTISLLPLLYAMHAVLLWGLALFLSAMAPYFRDLSEFVRVFLTVNIYLIPVMYVPDMVPEGLRFALLVNPFSHLIWCYQDVFYFGTIGHPASWAIVTAMTGGALLAGSYVFVRLRSHLASVV
jgi:lipopolysaccharide transport system permease protein